MTDELNYWTSRRISRRTALRGAGLGVAGLAGAALIGCGGGDDDEEEATPVATTAAGAATAAPTTAATAAPTEVQPKSGGVLRTAVTLAREHWSPIHGGSGNSVPATGYYDALTGNRETDVVDRQRYGRLAETIEQVDDLTILYTLKVAHFHDQPANSLNSQIGARQWTAEDVVELHEFRKKPPASYNSQFRDLMTITAIDDLTVKMETSKVYSLILDTRNAGFFFALPREMLDEETLKSEPPIGTGPYMYKSHQLGSREVLVRNPNYFVKDRPYLDGLEFTVVPDAAAQEAAFRANQTDYFRLQDIRQRNSVEQDLGDNVNMIDWLGGGVFSPLLNIRLDPWTDERARRAVHRAIDAQRVIDTVDFGDGYPCWVFTDNEFDRWPIGRDAVKHLVGFDKTEAKKLLDASIYDGREIEWSLSSSSQLDIDRSRIAMDDLVDIGFKLDINVLQYGQYVTKVGRKDTKDRTKPADFDMAEAVFTSYLLFRFDGYPAWNNSGPEDSEVEALIDKVYATVDMEQRKEYSNQFEMKMAEIASNFVPVYAQNEHAAWYSYVNGQDFEDSKSGTAGWQIDTWLDV